MAKLTRKHQKVFAGSATNNGQFGSAQTGAKVTSTDLDTLQNLAAFNTGWLDAVISGQKLPPLEEFQALDHIATRQIAYIFQEGIPEWNTSCEYHQNSIVKKTGTYELYGSLINTNTGNALPAAVDNANWKYLGTLGAMGLPAASDAESNAGTSIIKALVPANFAQQSKSANGYQKLPSGLIVQWGSVTFTTAGTANTFPIAFPTACSGLSISVSGVSSVNYYAATSTPSTNGFTGYLSGSGNTATVMYVAIGY